MKVHITYKEKEKLYSEANGYEIPFGIDKTLFFNPLGVNRKREAMRIKKKMKEKV